MKLSTILLSIFLVSFPNAAQEAEPEFTTWLFEEPLKLKRGSFLSTYPEASYLDSDQSCKFAMSQWGWSGCDGLEYIVVQHTENIDTVILEAPNSDGYVSYEDWNSENRAEEIDAIWSSLEADVAAQGENLGVEIKAVKWVVYPTLDQEKNYLYYATLLEWGGEPTINIKASLFDRNGYAAFRMVPVNSNAQPDELRAIIEDTLSAYTPNEGFDYSDFREGDKVAAAGSLGVLATLVGVKYGKAGFLAILLPFLKKAWFLLLIPLVWLRKKFFGTKEDKESN